MLDWLIADGRVALLAMTVLAAELAVAALAGLASRSFVANSISGLGLLSALYAALAGWGAAAVLAGLSVGFLAHLAWLFAASTGRPAVRSDPRSGR